MKIIKRSGIEMDFDLGKIEAAVMRANISVDEKDRLTDAQIQEILTSMGDLYTQKPQSYTLRFSSLLYEFLYILINLF